MRAAVGLIVNPAAGRDIRRLVGRASSEGHIAKIMAVRRVIAGTIAAGATDLFYLDDRLGLAREAVKEYERAVAAHPLSAETGTGADSTIAAGQMQAHGCGALVTLGGDGTNRAVAMGWPDAPLIAMSGGTNNVFAKAGEATIHGAAAGVLALGGVAIEQVARRSKIVHVEGREDYSTVALIDAVLLDGSFLGTGAIWHHERLRSAVLASAPAGSVGVAAIGGLIDPVSADEDAGLVLRFGSGGVVVHAPLTPGAYDRVRVSAASRLGLDVVVELCGPGVLALDGEREHVVAPGASLRMRISRDGPWSVDVDAVMDRAARAGWFQHKDGVSDAG